ncbi:MAG: NUDIX domain-containing protein [Patescibacteria group bacterium]
MNPYQGTKDHPHHISVGVILINDKNEVACHYYAEPKIRNYPQNFYTLLHESVEAGETLEQTATRGMKEEYSMKGTFERYVGSVVTHFHREEQKVEKTVLYFLCKLISIDEVRDLTCPESISEIKWLEVDELIKLMKAQGEDDESKILEDVKRFYLK